MKKIENYEKSDLFASLQSGITSSDSKHLIENIQHDYLNFKENDFQVGIYTIISVFRQAFISNILLGTGARALIKMYYLSKIPVDFL